MASWQKTVHTSYLSFFWQWHHFQLKIWHLKRVNCDTTDFATTQRIYWIIYWLKQRYRSNCDGGGSGGGGGDWGGVGAFKSWFSVFIQIPTVSVFQTNACGIDIFSVNSGLFDTSMKIWHRHCQWQIWGMGKSLSVVSQLSTVSFCFSAFPQLLSAHTSILSVVPHQRNFFLWQ